MGIDAPEYMHNSYSLNAYGYYFSRQQYDCIVYRQMFYWLSLEAFKDSVSCAVLTTCISILFWLEPTFVTTAFLLCSRNHETETETHLCIINRGVATGGISVYIPPNQSTLNFLMWLFWMIFEIAMTS